VTVKLRVGLCGLVLCGVSGCFQSGDEATEYDVGRVSFREAVEISGISASRQQANVIWAHNDSGDSARVFAMNAEGQHLGQYHLKSVVAEDWEDITIQGGHSGQSYLFIGDIGDNFGRRDFVTIYRIKEPVVHQEKAQQDKEIITLADVGSIQVQYPDQARDAEALMYDPWDDALYILTKREERPLLYRVSAGNKPLMWSGERVEAELVARLPSPTGGYPRDKVVAADISADGQDVLVKTYQRMLYWRRKPKQSLAEVLLTAPTYVPYVEEKQGESVAWSGQGYITTSEGFQQRIRLYPDPSTGGSSKNK